MIFLIRHGEDDCTRLGGWSDAGLSPLGREQVKRSCDKFADCNIKRIFSSDLQRAKETAEIIADCLNLPVTYLPEFRETNNGLLAGMLKTEAKEKYPGVYWNALEWTQHYPDGESPEAFFHRIEKAWGEFKANVKKDNVLLVSHGGVMDIILCIENGDTYTNKRTTYKIECAGIVSLEDK